MRRKCKKWGRGRERNAAGWRGAGRVYAGFCFNHRGCVTKLSDLCNDNDKDNDNDKENLGCICSFSKSTHEWSTTQLIYLLAAWWEFFPWTQKLNSISLKYEDGNSLEKAKFCLQWFSTEKFGPLLKYCRPRTRLGGADFQWMRWWCW